MANMKKFTRGQKEYVDGLLATRGALNERLVAARNERDEAKKRFDDLEKASMEQRGRLNEQLAESRKMHQDLLSAVEDYLEADNSQALADRRYEGAIGRLGDLHTEQGQEIQMRAMNTMALDYGAETDRWSARKQQ